MEKVQRRRMGRLEERQGMTSAEMDGLHGGGHVKNSRVGVVRSLFACLRKDTLLCSSWMAHGCCLS